jgi:uncharacterized protein YceK
MKKQLVIIGIVAILVTVGLSGCNEVSNTLSPEKNKFIGTWYKSNYLVMDLFSDGTCSYLAQSGTWDVKDDKLVLVLSSGYNPTFNYSFSDSDLTLRLTSTLDGSTTVYTKRGEL